MVEHEGAGRRGLARGTCRCGRDHEARALVLVDTQYPRLVLRLQRVLSVWQHAHAEGVHIADEPGMAGPLCTGDSCVTLAADRVDEGDSVHHALEFYRLFGTALTYSRRVEPNRPPTARVSHANAKNAYKCI